jgi:hypothetical protein
VDLLPLTPGGKSVQHARPLAQRVDDAGTDAEVVVDEVDLGLAACREVHPVGIGDAHDPITNGISIAGDFDAATSRPYRATTNVLA